MYYLETGYDKHNRLRNAILFALAAHTALILGISFDMSSSERNSRQLEVTLASRPSLTALEDARLLAQANQQGSGDQAELEQITSRSILLPAQPSPEQQALLPRPQSQNLAQDNVVTTIAAAHQTTAASARALLR